MPTIDADQLRKLAERADSRRGKDVFLVPSKNGAIDPFDIAEESELDGRTPILTLRTEDEQPAFADRSGTFTLQSTPRVVLDEFPDKGIEVVDAVFTSLVSMEKFLLPYYAQFLPPAKVKEMRDQFARDASALAVCHVPDSIETKMRAASTKSEIKNGQKPAGLFVLQLTPQETPQVKAVPMGVFLQP